MKVNDSGMPEEKYLESLFNIENIVSWANPGIFKLPIIEVGPSWKYDQLQMIYY